MRNGGIYAALALFSTTNPVSLIERGTASLLLALTICFRDESPFWKAPAHKRCAFCGGAFCLSRSPSISVPSDISEKRRKQREMELTNKIATRFARASVRSGCCTGSRSHLDHLESWIYDPDTRIVFLLSPMPPGGRGGGEGGEGWRAGIRSARHRNASATGRSVKSYRATIRIVKIAVRLRKCIRYTTRDRRRDTRLFLSLSFSLSLWAKRTLKDRATIRHSASGDLAADKQRASGPAPTRGDRRVDASRCLRSTKRDLRDLRGSLAAISRRKSSPAPHARTAASSSSSSSTARVKYIRPAIAGFELSLNSDRAAELTEGRTAVLFAVDHRSAVRAQREKLRGSRQSWSQR